MREDLILHFFFWFILSVSTRLLIYIYIYVFQNWFVCLFFFFVGETHRYCVIHSLICMRTNILWWEILSRLEKRTCLSSMRYRPSMVSNAFPDQSFSPCHHREIICSRIQRPTAPAIPRRYSFYAECPNLPSNVGSSTPPSSTVCAPHDARTRRVTTTTPGVDPHRARTTTSTTEAAATQATGNMYRNETWTRDARRETKSVKTIRSHDDGLHHAREPRNLNKRHLVRFARNEQQLKLGGI